MNPLISIAVWLIVGIPLHELGHYLVARRLGWHPIKLGLAKWHRIPYAVAVSATNQIDIKSNNDFFKAYKQLATFYAMGSLFSIMGIMFAYALEIFTSDAAVVLTATMALYMSFEITGLKHEASV